MKRRIPIVFLSSDYRGFPSVEEWKALLAHEALHAAYAKALPRAAKRRRKTTTKSRWIHPD